MIRSWVLRLIAATLILCCGPPCVLASTQLDAAFGLNGRVAIELGQRNGGHALLAQPDGKVVIAGSSSGMQGGAMNFALLRLDQNGSLDTSFNHEGSVITSLVAGDDEALALGRLADGRIVVGGYSFNGTDRDFALACYRANGTLDYSFGADGAILTSIGNSNEEIAALVVDPADRIVVVGVSEGTAGKILVAARYLPTGILDRSFGEQGIALIGLGQDASAEGVLLRKDGAIIISGSYVDQHGQAAMLVGLLADGTLDTGFGVQGVARVAEAFPVSEGYGVAEDEDGLLYLAGSVGKLGQREAALFRFTSHGSLDFAFGENGVTVLGQGPEDDVLYSVAADNGAITAGGFTSQNNTRRMLLVSLVPSARSNKESFAPYSEEQTAPIQEVRINGNTRVQIRKLQTWTSELLIRRMELLNSILQDPTAIYAPSAAKKNNSVFARWYAPFLPTAAYAATAETVSGMGGQIGSWETRIVTTSFGNGDSVCYALTPDMDGQVVVVGTAEDKSISSIVAARFVADDVIDRVTDRPGHRSSHISTLPSTEVTQTSLLTGGEINASFPKKIVRRGVLFSLKPGQLYREKQGGSAGITLDNWFDRLAGSVIPSAMAAEQAASKTERASVPEPVREEGITENGSGAGIFYARLEPLLPSSVYYIRAYAMTASGEIYYGDQISVRTADACFIATASFGTLLHPCVAILRDFRDTYLMQSSWGRKFVQVYYRVSPPIAAIIGKSPILRFLVRTLLLPTIGFSWLALHFSFWGAMLTLGLLVYIIGHGWRRIRRSGVCC
ncbi:MAG: delta-60 repeat domain-containing protein [Desulfobulbus sp.]|nr:delta-60 repeat domain-containing protein [Desulfobulbus sp.]